METPARVVVSGKARVGLEAGPRFLPKSEKSEPRAIDPAGNPACMKLAALRVPRPKIWGGWARAAGGIAARIRVKKTPRIWPPSCSIIAKFSMRRAGALARARPPG